jgi:branched-chain amino acid transport system permease protein
VAVPSLDSTLQALLDGLMLGGVYALMTSGLALTFGVMRVANFAQGDFVTLGMYVAYMLWTFFGVDPYLGAIVVAALIMVAGSLVELGLLERLPQAAHQPQFILTLGLSVLIENIIQGVAGATPFSVNTSYSNSYAHVGSSIVFQTPEIYAAITAVIALVALQVFLQRTRFGRSLRATTDDPMAAEAVGVSIRTTRAIAFGIGTGLAGLAGCALSTFQLIQPTNGQSFLFLMFVAVLIGGVGSLLGATIGALIVGLVQALAVLVIPLQLDNGVIYLLLLVILFIRPFGLFGVRARV